MSTLTVSTIKKTGETASRDASGVAAAWVNFNGTGTVAIRESFNCSSLTDVGVGIYYVTLTNSMFGDALYSSQVTNTDDGIGRSSSANTESIVYMVNRNTSFSSADTLEIQATIHGDLA